MSAIDECQRPESMDLLRNFWLSLRVTCSFKIGRIWEPRIVLTSIALLSPEWFFRFFLGAIDHTSVYNFDKFVHRVAPFSTNLE